MIVLPDNELIEYFSLTDGSRSDNDKNNKIRENIITCMPYIDEEYFNDPIYGNKWRQLKMSFDLKMKEICPIYASYKINHMAGRRYNYDFNVRFFDENNKLLQIDKLEFKYNASKIDEAPQFVSPMNPSQFLTKQFEEYYYHNYLVHLLNKYNLPVPDIDTYLKQVHKPKPKCLEQAQLLYYQGCGQSSKYTGSKHAESFYNECIEVSQECIKHFIMFETDLNFEKLTEYLCKSQEGKIYLLCKNSEFTLEYPNQDDYIIESYEKLGNQFVATTKTNKKMHILLRWKNGNGIAYPAFQIH